MHDTIIEAHGLKRYYRRGNETVKALDGVDLTIRTGEIVSILGPSGSGKTTLINLLSCLDAPTEGMLTVAGKSVAGLSEDELVEVRRGVLGFVFQQFSLRPSGNWQSGVDAALGGWQVGGILSLRTGFPFDVTYPGDAQNRGTANRGNRIGVGTL